MVTTVYKSVHLTTKNSMIYNKVIVTIRGAYILQADENT